jgi:hypothetical protein
MKFAHALIGAVVALPAASWACGVCVEDKVAATYDHAVMQRAVATGRVVVFCEVGGQLDARALKKAAGRVQGLDRASVRVSAQPAAMSFALDEARQSRRSAVAAIERAAPPGTRLAIVRVIGAGAGAPG